MDIKATNLARAKIYQFLSTLYRDEIPLWLIEKMADKNFLDKELEVTGTVKAFYKLNEVRTVLELNTWEIEISLFCFFMNEIDETKMKTKTLLLAILTICSVNVISQIIHVPADQPTIQEGINAAENGDTVLVDEGTYYENINFKGKAITVASLFWDDGDTNHINNTIIDGSQPLDPDTASVVRFVNGEDTTSIICGFTITGGKGTNLQPVINYRAGGGILCWNSGAKIISNYIVYDSLLTDIQGIGCGIYGGPNGSNSYLLIENNKIQNNYIYSTSPDYFATGAGIGTDCHCIIKGNNISYNTSIAENWRASAPVNCRGFNNNVRFNSISENIINHNITISRADFEPQVFGGAIYIMYNYGNISNNEIKYNEVAAESSDGKCTGSGITLLYMDESFIVSNNIISYNKFRYYNFFY